MTTTTAPLSTTRPPYTTATVPPRPFTVRSRVQWTVTAPSGQHALTAVGVVLSLRDAGVTGDPEDHTPVLYGGGVCWILTSRLSALPLPIGL